jgi:hypothetical protein
VAVVASFILLLLWFMVISANACFPVSDSWVSLWRHLLWVTAFVWGIFLAMGMTFLVIVECTLLLALRRSGL